MWPTIKNYAFNFHFLDLPKTFYSKLSLMGTAKTPKTHIFYLPGTKVVFITTLCTSSKIESC